MEDNGDQQPPLAYLQRKLNQGAWIKRNFLLAVNWIYKSRRISLERVF